MELTKKNFTKLATIGVFAFVVLGLTACGGTGENQDTPTETTTGENQDTPTETTEVEQGIRGSSSESEQLDMSVFDDFPEWWHDSLTAEEKEMIFNSLTAEELEELREQVEGWGPSTNEGSQIILGSSEGNGSFEVNEDGEFVPID